MGDSAGAVASGKWNLYLVRSALVAALGGLLFGFDTAVISGAKPSSAQT